MMEEISHLDVEFYYCLDPRSLDVLNKTFLSPLGCLFDCRRREVLLNVFVLLRI